MTEPKKPRIRRNEPAAPKGDGLKRAAAKVKTLAADSSTVKPYTYPIKPPKLAPGVAPKGVTPPVMAMDLNPYAFAAETYPGGGFPGFRTCPNWRPVRNIGRSLRRCPPK